MRSIALYDTFAVYIVRNGDEAAQIDFGCGAVLDALPEIGVERVTAILITHHHRDQVQGLPRAVEQGIPIWVPSAEQDLFANVEEHWQSRPVANNYDNRQDRFSLLEPVPVAGLLGDYSSWTFAGTRFTVLPTPGHTTGSITLLADVDGQRVAFSGDLIAAPGQVWSLAATQWSYHARKACGQHRLAGVPQRPERRCSCPRTRAKARPGLAIDLLIERLWRLLVDRGEHSRLLRFLDQPYDAITPHLLWNRTSVANAYVLLSQSGKALMIDFGYDFMTGFAAGTDRASRRPWLYTIPKLKSDFKVSAIDAVILTLPRRPCGGLQPAARGRAQVWAAENFSNILQFPEYYDLPCLWYDPIPVDRVLPLETPIAWEEYTLSCYPLPGHTRYAVAIAFEVDGQRVLAVGDQYQSDTAQSWNYVYANRFNLADSGVGGPSPAARARPDRLRALGAALGRAGLIRPDRARARRSKRNHRAMLPLETFNLAARTGPRAIHPIASRRGGERADGMVECVIR